MWSTPRNSRKAVKTMLNLIASQGLTWFITTFIWCFHINHMAAMKNIEQCWSDGLSGLRHWNKQGAALSSPLRPAFRSYWASNSSAPSVATRQDQCTLKPFRHEFTIDMIYLITSIYIFLYVFIYTCTTTDIQMSPNKFKYIIFGPFTSCWWSLTSDVPSSWPSSAAPGCSNVTGTAFYIPLGWQNASTKGLFILTSSFHHISSDSTHFKN